MFKLSCEGKLGQSCREYTKLIENPDIGTPSDSVVSLTLLLDEDVYINLWTDMMLMHW